MESQLAQYVPVMILGLVALSFAAGNVVLSTLLGQKGRNSDAKNLPYECGVNSVGEGTSRMSVKFYLVAMLFILFDIEVVFMYPWAVIFQDMLATEYRNLIFGSMLSFVGVLLIGYIYALKKKAFDWKS